ncbi:response regulator transcription factor [Thermosulfurimonas sp. F29]|uniref:response regulator transcription factor n=1 Tax=Thermosulfurimonas sp. F29 TaxID=2867247 RepID=UPI001C838DF0|nr:helix-turn-helix transcriptional regulator [Thermosulfurimonas sp. F29]MBX6423141.1 helix-turn-helix transcriptional regulator [Thermosulfurimonas sp. F29]
MRERFALSRGAGAIAALAAYDLWLLAFPLQGYFLLKAGGKGNFAWFVVPHTAGLFLTGVFGHRMGFPVLSRWAGLLVSLLTAIYPFAPAGAEDALMIPVGAASALLIVRIACLLSDSRDPPLASALGLALGNVLLGMTLLFDPPKEILFPLLGFLLLIQMVAPFPEQRPEPLADLKRYLPFIFAFYLLIGTFYVCLMPAYLEYRYLSGVELVFYIGAVLASATLFRRKPDYSLAVGVGMGVFAVAFLHEFNRLTSNLAMYAVQAAAGFMDVFCFGLFIRGRDVVRRFGLGAGAMLLGPTVGLPVLYSERWPMLMCVGGNLVLGLGLILFYLVQTTVRRREVVSPREKTAPASPVDETRLAEACRALGTPRELFSYREWETLKLALAGKPIREIASALGLSESSVKTYLQRVYRKLGVSSKSELIRKLGSLAG